jgi:alpha-1,3-rhamnosyl/mannosyltransferase
MATRPPRIALAAHRFASLEQSGIPRYVAELCAAIGRRDDRDGYVLVTPPEAGDASGCGVPVERLRGGRRVVQLGWHLAGRPRFEHLTSRPALVHSLYPFAPIPTSVPLVTTFHDLLPMSRPEWFGRVNAAKFRRASRYLAAESSHLVADSEVVAAELGRRLGVERERITVVPLGVSTAFRQPVTAAQAREVCARHGLEPGSFFVAVGYVSRRKNLVTVLRALAAAGPAVRLPVVFAGPAGRGSEAVAAEAARLHLADRVVVTGPLPETELATVVASAVALLHPATHEGFGLPPLEAMAAGTPVIASRGGAVQEVAGDGALLVDPDDVDAWADALVQLEGDAGRRDQLRAAGRARALLYTWDRTAELTVEVHRRVLQDSR